MDDVERRRMGAVVVLALVAAFAAWFFLIRDGDDEDNGKSPRVVTPTEEIQPFGPAPADEEDLENAAAELGHPVYWAGRAPDGVPELTVTGEGSAIVRYLTGGAAPGAEQADFLTVATYELTDARAAIEATAQKPGRVTFELADGGLAVIDTAEPTRVYFAEEGSNLQVEVFDPDPNRAREFVESGEIVPIG